ncbi:MAG: phosphotyrosine protein phosphatase [Sphingomonas sp.]
MKHILFVCSQNRLRSPTAEQIFSTRSDFAVSSAGTNHDAENPITDELITWADLIFVMERHQRNKLQKRFRSAIKDKRVVSLEIPDDYQFMDASLIRLLRTKMARYLPAAPLED